MVNDLSRQTPQQYKKSLWNGKSYKIILYFLFEKVKVIRLSFTFMYKLEVLDYITKEAPDEVRSRIRTCVKIAYERYMQLNASERKSFEVMIGSRKRVIPLSEVCFIETCSGDHRLALHTLNSRVEFRGYMKEIELNNPSLVRVHRAYLANLDNAREFDVERRVLEMANGEFCHVAYRKMSLVKKELEQRQNMDW